MIIFFPISLFLQDLSYPLNFMFFLSQKNQYRQTKKKNQQDQHKNNNNSTKTEVYLQNIIWNRFCVGQLFNGHGAWTWAWLIYSVTLYWKKDSFLSQKVINCKWLLRDKTLHPLSLLGAGILSGLDVYRMHAYCQKLSMFTCVSVVLCLENTVFLELLTTFGSYKPSASSSS